MHQRRAKLLSVLLGLAAPLFVQAQTIESYTFTTNRVVPDGNAAGLADTRTLSSTIGVLNSVKVRLKIDGEYNGDLYGYLRHIQNGVTNFAVLLNRPGRSASLTYGYPDDGFDVTFADGAANGDIHVYQNVTLQAAPLTGTWQPDGRLVDPAVVTELSPRTTSLSSFGGNSGSGQWTLYLADVDSGGTNLLREWGLDLSGAASATLAWSNPADITYGTALSGSQLNATVTYNATNVPGTFTYSPAAGTVLSAGAAQTLTVVFTPADSASFLPLTNTVVINVNPATLNVAANPQTKVYGAGDPALDYSATGLQGSDTAATVLSGTLTRDAGESVGSYAITQGTLAANANYTIAFTGSSLSITPATLAVTADPQTKVYGMADPTLSYSATGFQFSDTAGTVLTGALARDAGENAGSYAINQGSLAANANYTIAFTGSSLSITPAPITVAAAAKSKVYGDADPALTYQLTSGSLVGSDGFSGSLSRVAGENAGTYAIQQGSLTAGANYNLSYVGASLTITPKELLAQADDKSRAYGDANPELTIHYSGFVGSDSVSNLMELPVASTLATTNSPIGTYEITLTGGSDTNYSLVLSNGTLTVTAAALTVAADAQTKVYGDADPALTYQVTSGALLAGDSFSGSLTRVAGEDVGSYAIQQGTLTAGTNYTLSFVSADLSITPASLAVNANPQTKVYGAADPTLTYSATGFKFTDNAASVLTGALTRDAGENVGSYAITQGTLAANANYTIAFTGSTLSITPATLAVNANPQTKVYGAADPTLSYATTGFQFSDNAASVLTGALSRDAGENVGSYAITEGNLAANANYTIAFTGSSLSITPASLAVTANPQTKVYGAADPALSYAATGFQFSDNAAGVLTGALSRDAGENVGSYAITQGSLAANANYTIAYTGSALSITPASLAVTANPQTKVYGAADPTLSYSATGFQFSDNAAGVLTGALSRDAGEDAGSYAITQGSLAANANYTIAFTGSTLTITPASITGSLASSANPALPGANVTFTLTLNHPATGTVNFRIDGTVAGSASLAAGVATYSTSSLTHGSHTVVAEYAATQNYLGSTNALSPDQVINTAPLAGDLSIARYATQGVKISVANILTNASDADSDSLSLTVAATSANNGTITVSNGWVYYTPAEGFTNTDSFTYTVDDGHGGSATGTITVNIQVDNTPGANLAITALGGGSMRIDGSGIPNRTYRMQYTDSLSPANWQDLPSGSVTADANGVFQFTDTTGAPTRYYRSVTP